VIRNYTDENVMECPSCGGGYLRHNSVEVFVREEDADDGLHVVVECESPKSCKINGEMFGNISGRRGSIRIEFQCETCGEKALLEIVQHKGMVYKFVGSKY